MAAARICLLSPQKKIAYDHSLRQRLPAGRPADLPRADALDPGLAAVLETTTAGRLTITRGRRKKPQSGPTALIAVAAATVVVLGLLGLWWAIGQGNPPDEAAVAKVADPAKSAKPLKEASPTSPVPSQKHASSAASSEAGGDSQGNVFAAADTPKPPEPKAGNETQTAPISGKTIAAAAAAERARRCGGNRCAAGRRPKARSAFNR